MNKVNITLLTVFVSLLTFGVLTYAYPSIFNTSVPSSDINHIQYDSLVCTSVERGATGMIEDLGCSHNLVVDSGLDAIRDWLVGTTNFNNFTFIGLCNSTAGCGVDSSDTSVDNEFTSNGLTRQAGTTSTLGTGNWTVFTTFTSSGASNLQTNVTGIYNQSTGGTMLAENSFTEVTLDGTSGDTLLVNWTIFVTSG